MCDEKKTKQKIKNGKFKSKYKLIIGDKEYINTGCVADLEGHKFCIFERKNGLICIEKFRFAKEDLIIDHDTGICRLKEIEVKI